MLTMENLFRSRLRYCSPSNTKSCIVYAEHELAVIPLHPTRRTWPVRRIHTIQKGGRGVNLGGAV